jgi:hypothetical protein
MTVSRKDLLKLFVAIITHKHFQTSNNQSKKKNKKNKNKNRKMNKLKEYLKMVLMPFTICFKNLYNINKKQEKIKHL